MRTTLEPISIDLADGRRVVVHEAVRRHPAEFALGTYHEGELVGIVVCDTEDAPTGRIVIVVKAGWRGLGVGRSLLGTMVQRAQDLGFSFLTVSYSTGNRAASAMLAASDLVVARRLRKGVVKAALQVPAATSDTAEASLAA